MTAEFRCEDARPLLSEGMDQPLPAETEGQVARHLSQCGACARFRADLLEIDAVLGTESAASPSANTWDAIEAFVGPPAHESSASGRLGALRPNDRRRTFAYTFGHSLARFAAAVLVVAGGFLAFRAFVPDMDPVWHKQEEKASILAPAEPAPRESFTAPKAHDEEPAAPEKDAEKELDEALSDGPTPF
ncbi:MAG: zf-HC2 domain-containing protein [Planctomycetota bacterium]|jgi:anti-sigma factor RsiW